MPELALHRGSGKSCHVPVPRGVCLASTTSVRQRRGAAGGAGAKTGLSPRSGEIPLPARTVGIPPGTHPQPAESFAEGSCLLSVAAGKGPFPEKETGLNSGNGCTRGRRGHPPASSKAGDARLCLVHSRVVGRGCAVVCKLIAALPRWRRSRPPAEPPRLRQLSGPGTGATLSIRRCSFLMGVFKVFANRPPWWGDRKAQQPLGRFGLVSVPRV